MTDKAKFKDFLERFPELPLPLTLRDDSHHDFEQNKPLSDEMIASYITRYEIGQVDDFTEYVACFSFPKVAKQPYQAVVYWKAALMQYDYVLATYSLDGNMIDKKAIAGTKVVGNLAAFTPKFRILSTKIQNRLRFFSFVEIAQIP